MRMQSSAISHQLSGKKLMVNGLWFMLVLLLVLLFTIHYLPPTTHAAVQLGVKQPGENAGVIVGNTSADALLGGVFRNAIVLTFTIASVSAVIMFLWGAVRWILSGGDKDAVAAARKKIVAALVGLIILAVSFLILSLVGVFVGINPLKDLKIPGLGDNITNISTKGAVTNPADPNYKCGNSAYWDAKQKKCISF